VTRARILIAALATAAAVVPATNVLAQDAGGDPGVEIVVGGPGNGKPVSKPRGKLGPTTTARVVDVRDGATLRVRLASGATRTVRLVGLIVPVVRRSGAVECGALSAWDALLRRAFTRSRDTDGDGLRDTKGGAGRSVTLQTDGAVRSARRGPLQAYVRIRGGSSLNLAQLQGGWAKPSPAAARLALASTYRSVSGAAQAKGAGVWGGCDGDFHADGSVIY